MTNEFSRIAVVNRGEAAMRFIHAVREWNTESGAQARTIALYSEAEHGAMFVREADEAICIGSSDERGRLAGASAYLDHRELEWALRAARADAAWVGWGFVAEDPVFAELCARLGVVFIGPSPDVMRRLGDKISAKVLAEETGVPVAAWSGGPVASLEDAKRHGAAIGYPLMIKAAAGGGGRGIRIVTGPDELPAAFERSGGEALRAFGDGTVFMERVVSRARHVEVQIIADDYGTVWSLGVRECSIQRRNQKVVEESASPVFTAAQDRALRNAAKDLARAAGYRNAGTVEFLYEPDEQRLSFLEVNPRLQVEHPVTEMTTGVDLVKLQLHVAAGRRLEGDPPATFGHAIEARLNAEDPEHGFAPSPGTIEFLRFPNGPGIRVDSGSAEGDVIPAAFDSMIAKIIAWGHDRREALARLRRALDQTVVVVRGGTTNRCFLLRLLERPEIAASGVDTAWLDRLTASGDHVSVQHADVALLVAAIDAYDADATLERTRFYAAAARGRPKARPQLGAVAELHCRGHGYRAAVARTGPGSYAVGIDGEHLGVEIARRGRFESRLDYGGRAYRVVSRVESGEHVIEVDGVGHRISRDDGGTVRAVSPGVIIAINVEPGDIVDAGSSVAVVEAMKMETTVVAPFHGRVREVFVAANVQVDAGAPLLTLEPIGTGDDASHKTARVTFEQGAMSDASSPRARCLAVLEAFRCLVLGFDIDPNATRRLVEEYNATRHDVAEGDTEILHAELHVLNAFADLCALSRNRRDEDSDADDRGTAREYLFSFLRSLDVDAEGLPESFRVRLQRAVAHFGLDALDHTAELEETMYRVFQAHERVGHQVPAVLALLDRRLEHPDTLSEELLDEFRETLDRLIVATQLRSRFVGDLARSLRFTMFDAPHLARARDAVYDEMREHLAYLGSHPDGPEYAERIESLVACPQPLIQLLAERGPGGFGHEPMLEVLTRRYYKVEELQDLQTIPRGDNQLVTAQFVRDDQRFHVIATAADFADLANAMESVAALALEAPPAADVIVELYLCPSSPSSDGDALAEELRILLGAHAWPHPVRRVVVSVCPRGRDGAEPAVDCFTFDRANVGFTEDTVVRGIHPMIARRLHFWRLVNFRIQRLASSSDVYLFDCVGRDNPGDRRLIALAEVRDLTPTRDASARVTALPELERVLVHCVEDIRGWQLRQRPEERSEWNRIVLYVWPWVDAALDELLGVVNTLAPITQGIGLEQVVIQARVPQGPTGALREVVLHVSDPTGTGVTTRLTDPPTAPLQPLDEYTQKVLRSRRRGNAYPYELVPLLVRAAEHSVAMDAGTFTEYDLDGERLVPVARPPGRNTAAVVVGVVRTPTIRYPEGMTRVALFGDPTKALGSIAEPECRRVIAAIDLAEAMSVPVEWFAVSAGAAVAMESGTENLDWVARVLRRIVEFTQAGGEINVVVTGVNVGGQSYWNAEAAMLMHTRGILVMTPDSSMVLTGKQALEFSGAVAAEDNAGIGGYERIMGPNGEAQYWAPDVAAACRLLLTHYEHTYRAPGERFPRRAATSDVPARDVGESPHMVPELEFGRIGEIFSDVTNAGRKKPFDIRSVMRAVIDQDHPPLERWASMRDAETAVVLDARLDGHAICLIGIESRPLRRYGLIPADGPDQWTAGTLFPLSSKKVARAINAASGNRPLVVLANLSGFDGSPESMRKLQLEFGAEIGRAIVNFDGPIVFCAISRYHGGAFVVFSRALNDTMEVAALEGSYASVIGGTAAAGVVFTGEVNERTRADPRVRTLATRVQKAEGTELAQLRRELDEATAAVRFEKLGEVAAEFDAVHSVERALEVGSVDHIIPPSELRPYLIDAVDRGQRRVVERSSG